MRIDGTVFVCIIFRCFLQELRRQFTDEYADTGIDIKGVHGCLNDLKSIKTRYPHIKTILSLGGGGEGSAPFPAVASNGNIRSVFAQKARQIVDAYGLDGIDSKQQPAERGLLFTYTESRLGTPIELHSG